MSGWLGVTSWTMAVRPRPVWQWPHQRLRDSLVKMNGYGPFRWLNGVSARSDTYYAKLRRMVRARQ